MQWLELTSAALPAAQLESGLFGCCLALLGGRQLLVSNARVDLYAAFACTVLLHGLCASCPAFWIIGAGGQNGPADGCVGARFPARCLYGWLPFYLFCGVLFSPWLRGRGPLLGAHSTRAALPWRLCSL